jgi:hypothetical protein
MTSRFHALIAVMAKTRLASSPPSNSAAACSQTSSGTCVSATSVIALQIGADADQLAQVGA